LQLKQCSLLLSALYVFQAVLQLKQCSLLLSALYKFRAVFSAHHQEPIKLYVQP